MQVGRAIVGQGIVKAYHTTNTADMHVCSRLPEACKGFTTRDGHAVVDYNGSQPCATGYRGNLCLACAHGYGRSHQAACKKCPGKITNRIYIAVGFFASLSVRHVGRHGVMSTPHDAFTDHWARRLHFTMQAKLEVYLHPPHPGADFPPSTAWHGYSSGSQLAESPRRVRVQRASMRACGGLMMTPTAGLLRSILSAAAGVSATTHRFVSFDCWLNYRGAPNGEVYYRLQVCSWVLCP